MLNSDNLHRYWPIRPITVDTGHVLEWGSGALCSANPLVAERGSPDGPKGGPNDQGGCRHIEGLKFWVLPPVKISIFCTAIPVGLAKY